MSTHYFRARDLVVLQRSAGNQAVSRLLHADDAPDARVSTPAEAVPVEQTPRGVVDRLLGRVRLIARKEPCTSQGSR